MSLKTAFKGLVDASKPHIKEIGKEVKKAVVDVEKRIVKKTAEYPAAFKKSIKDMKKYGVKVEVSIGKKRHRNNEKKN